MQNETNAVAALIESYLPKSPNLVRSLHSLTKLGDNSQLNN